MKNISPHSLISYWRNSLADADKMGLSSNEMILAEQFPLTELENGYLSKEKVQRFFEEEEKKARDKLKYSSKKIFKSEDDIKVDQLSVIIAPYVAVKNCKHGQQILGEYQANKIFPLWIIAKLNRDGSLKPVEQCVYPWINRRCLAAHDERNTGLGYPILGNVSDVDDFYTEHMGSLDSSPQNWKKLFSLAKDLLLFLCSEKKSIFSDQGYSLNEVSYVLPKDHIPEPSRNIIATYDQYLFTRKPIPHLLKKFSSMEDEPYCTDQSLTRRLMSSGQHLGQMQKDYPLAASQRESISYFSDPHCNEIFTIQGPPGTGKTTLLQSVIASNWVKNALERLYPPIQVAASTNNLAVTNILDRLNEAGKDASRWLPDFNTYGLYLAPASREEQVKEKNYQVRLRGAKSGSIEFFYTDEYRTHATIHFLNCFNNNFKKSEIDLMSCQKIIHQELLVKNGMLQKTIQFVNNFHKLEEKFIDRYGRLETLDELILKNSHDILIIEEDIKRVKELHIRWCSYKIKGLSLLRLFSWIPFVAQLLKDRIQLFTLQYDFFQQRFSTIDEVESVFDTRESALILRLKQLKEKRDNCQSDKESYRQLLSEKTQLEEQLGFTLNTVNLFDFSDPTNVLCKLDQTLRYDLFILAMHYWEAQWLLESQLLDCLDYDHVSREKYWRIQAMLTPCFVTTLHSGPGFFQYKTNEKEFETLEGVIDLLIIDEAGQVMPAIAGAMISAAKNLLLVGDDKQIEPIFSLNEKIDFANTKKYGLCVHAEDYESLKNRGILCSGNANSGKAYGNLIVVGRRKSKYHLKGESAPGLLLKEHRRCAKEIISYCNELCYNNQLLPLTREQFTAYPRMGYVHFRGSEKIKGSSRLNPEEAALIAKWIQKNQTKILSMCNEDRNNHGELHLSDCIGIVTPFAAQGHEIRSALVAHQLKIDKVGTIHSLQGSEKSIIIFSPVYTSSEQNKTFFFDRSTNMLNVAVSRAKRSFLVFGDMEIFKASNPRSPSGLLAKHLFAQKDNEILLLHHQDSQRDLRAIVDRTTH